MIKLIIKDKIKIGSKTFAIEFIDKLISDGDELYGDCNYGKGTIRLNSSYPEEQQELTFLHELRHLVLDACGYSMDEDIKIDEGLIIRQQTYDHQIIKQIIAWQG